MGISLYGLTPATTYDALIKTGDNEPLTASLKVLSDGVGTNLPMEASTTGINFTGTTTVGGVAVANTTQVAAKQDTLVSGTNIKTINGTSVLGSGNIVTPTTPPSGVSGAIQFSNGSAFASDAANLFWDDTNNRLGVGTNAPTSPVSISNTGGNILDWIRVSGASGSIAVTNYRSGAGQGTVFNINEFSFRNTSAENYIVSELNRLGLGTNNDALTARMTIKGSGSTSATTSLLVQNSAGTNILKIGDGARIDVLGTIGQIDFSSYYQLFSTGNQSTVGCYKGGQAFSVDGSRLCVNVATGSHSASASFQVDSTTTGILPPRMTTTQKNAIASPAAGLVVYDSTTNKLCCYNGSTWNDLF